jgi:DNA repair protein RadC
MIQYEAPTPYAVSRESEDQTIAKALEILHRRLCHENATYLTSPDVARDYLRVRLGQLEHEVFGCLFLDNRHRVLAFEEMFRGTIDGASVHPREVVKEALRYNAAAAILAHNHPSGTPEPSRADESITRRLKEALGLIDVRVLDHMIVGGTSITSFAERGLL